MSGTVVNFYPKDAASVPDNVLEQAKGVYQDVIIMGWDNDGYLEVRSSLGLNGKDINWILDNVKRKLLNGDYF